MWITVHLQALWVLLEWFCMNMTQQPRFFRNKLSAVSGLRVSITVDRCSKLTALCFSVLYYVERRVLVVFLASSFKCKPPHFSLRLKHLISMEEKLCPPLFFKDMSDYIIFIVQLMVCSFSLRKQWSSWVRPTHLLLTNLSVLCLSAPYKY